MSLTVEYLTKLIQIAILAAIAYILTLFAVPIIPIAPYLKLDLSDLPILMGTVTLGIGAGISVAALAVVLHLLMTGFALPAILGDTVLFVSSLAVLLAVGLLIRWKRRRPSWQRNVTLITVLTVSLTAVMALVNLMTIPLYMKLAGLKISLPVTKLVEFGIVPFNLIKGVVIGLLFVLMDRYLSRSKYFNSIK